MSPPSPAAENMSDELLNTTVQGISASFLMPVWRECSVLATPLPASALLLVALGAEKIAGASAELDTSERRFGKGRGFCALRARPRGGESFGSSACSLLISAQMDPVLTSRLVHRQIFGHWHVRSPWVRSQVSLTAITYLRLSV